eukprot:gene17365-28591_t
MPFSPLALEKAAEHLQQFPPGSLSAVVTGPSAEPTGFPGEPWDGLYKGWEGMAGTRNELTPVLVAMGLNRSRLRAEHWQAQQRSGKKCSGRRE